ncbi:hypothetical protein BABINDRAFT_163847 [Babjeviella inositovora NRRL Y-12698]|uniref:Calcipressin n=1 Tax=Babjeviella inositovora NRRL Y-12698 TaxID=984486 RepID=A0A1E3QHE9_9ASCO|nr:uncharacterized protein BABINDRAFT_163847 [Babjeviella inositovora NRRL Y-12698]ODQ77119.1 hypothetical protein BABINDRAFT_163847 [Babjeviella inositovora NRRL Y-12698]
MSSTFMSEVTKLKTSNTLIVSLPTSPDSDAQLDELLQLLQDVLVSDSDPEEYNLVPLPSFHRLLVVCSSQETARNVYNSIMATGVSTIRSHVSFSAKDNHFTSVSAEEILPPTFAALEYLQLPPEDAHTRFLISPPPSPPVGWNFSVKEDGPNANTYHDINELRDLLFQRLLVGDEKLVKVVKHESGTEEVSRRNGSPIIILDPPASPGELTGTTSKSLEHVKTPMPPLDYALYEK